MSILSITSMWFQFSLNLQAALNPKKSFLMWVWRKTSSNDERTNSPWWTNNCFKDFLRHLLLECEHPPWWHEGVTEIFCLTKWLELFLKILVSVIKYTGKSWKFNSKQGYFNWINCANWTSFFKYPSIPHASCSHMGYKSYWCYNGVNNKISPPKFKHAQSNTHITPRPFYPPLLPQPHHMYSPANLSTDRGAGQAGKIFCAKIIIINS